MRSKLRQDQKENMPNIQKKIAQTFGSGEFKDLLKRYKVKRIAIFGSYARGQEKKNSDIDFLVEFHRGADLLDQVGLKQDLQDMLKKQIDVISHKALSKYIKDRVLKEAVYFNE